MAARVQIGKNLTAASSTPASIHIGLADPPYNFTAPGTWTGTIVIQHSADTFPEPSQYGAAEGVADSAATWHTLVTLTPGAFLEFKDPIYRVRANPSTMTGGTANVYMLEGIRSLKNPRSHGTRSQRQTRNG